MAWNGSDSRSFENVCPAGGMAFGRRRTSAAWPGHCPLRDATPGGAVVGGSRKHATLANAPAIRSGRGRCASAATPVAGARPNRCGSWPRTRKPVRRFRDDGPVVGAPRAVAAKKTRDGASHRVSSDLHQGRSTLRGGRSRTGQGSSAQVGFNVRDSSALPAGSAKLPSNSWMVFVAGGNGRAHWCGGAICRRGSIHPREMPGVVRTRSLPSAATGMNAPRGGTDVREREPTQHHSRRGYGDASA
jgi:hypothetical protein